ncbi:MAG: hypothetical protein KAH18_04785, partial [Psychromonas sp.]|nr:hypothetical protein [Psychromonas sp.]
NLLNHVSIRLVDTVNKHAGLINTINGSSIQNLTVTDPSSFDAVPGSPFSYWVGDNLRELFKKNQPYKSEKRNAVVGLQTGDDFRFARMWWEVSLEDIAPADTHSELAMGPYCQLAHKWQSFAKGGKLSPYYNDLKMVCDWEIDGYKLKNFKGAVIRNSDCYYQSGFTWPLRALRYTPSVIPKGTVFSVRSMASFCDIDSLKSLIVLGNSKLYDMLFKLKLGQSGRPEFIVGVANVLPIPDSNLSEHRAELEGYFNEGYKNSVAPYLCDETSRLYSRCWFEFLDSDSLEQAVTDYTDYARKQKLSIENLQNKVDIKVMELYGIEQSDLPKSYLENNWTTVTGLPIKEGDDISRFLAKDIVSNLFGRMFGRFSEGSDINLTERDALAPLPIQTLSLDYKLPNTLPESLQSLLKKGIAPMGDDFSVNANDAISELLVFLYPDKVNLNEEVQLSLNGRSLKQYIMKPMEFFQDHLTKYSGFSRISPVYLPLSSSSGNFVLWLFYPKLSRSTLYAVINDVLEPTISELEDNYKTAKTVNNSQHIKIASLLEEARDLRDQINDVLVGGFQCNIDDGVVLCSAPFKRLFLNANWRDELKNRWVGLEQGEYDWSSLALSYWPQRVFNKCRQDRSIAIAHSVENDLWHEVEVPATRGKGTKLEWQPREMTPQEYSSFVQKQLARLKES